MRSVPARPSALASLPSSAASRTRRRARGSRARQAWVGRAAWPLRESRSEEHTSELQSQSNLVCRLLLEKKKKQNIHQMNTRRTEYDDTDESAMPTVQYDA